MKLLILALFGCSFVAVCQTTVLLETFDAGMPVDWELINNDGNTPHPSVAEYTDAWIVVTDPDDASNQVVSSTSYFQPVDRADRWLISPNVTLGNGGNFISWYAKSHDPSFPDSYKVLLSTTGTAISDFQDTLMLVTSETPEWLKREMQIEGFEDQSVHVAFVLTSFNGFKLYMDSIHIRIEDPLDLENELLAPNAMSVFPNPTSEWVKLKSDFPIHDLQILSLNGQLVYQEENYHEQTIHVGHLQNGIYMIVATMIDGRRSQTKLVIAH
jgi:hypothetical protein